MNQNVEQTVSPRGPNGEIRFRRNEPFLFIATKPFSLGSTGLGVKAGTEIWYDGTTASVDGDEYNLPFLRGAVKARWLVLVEEYDPEENYAVPQRANISVRPAIATSGEQQARMAISTTESDEREVGNVNAHANRTRTANQKYVRNQTQVNAGGRMVTIEPQDGVVVPGRTLKTLAGQKSKQRTTELGSQAAAEEMQLANNLKIEPGQGISREEMMERMSEDERAAYEAEIESRKGAYVSEPVGPKVVGRVKTAKQSESLGIRVTNSVGNGTSIGDEGVVVGQVGQDEIETFESEGIKFTTTNGPRNGAKKRTAPVARVEKASDVGESLVSPEIRRSIAKTVCPDFPENYDFSLPSKKKMARITADFEDRPEVLRAIFLAEDDTMKAFLVKEFPGVFSA